MIRQWFIIGVLSVLLIWLFWGFYVQVVVYDPMDAVRTTTPELTDGVEAETEFKPAWGREIVSKNVFSKLRGYIPPPPPKKPEVVEVKPELPPPPPPTPPKVMLSGIILNQYGEFMAIIQQQDGKIKRVMEGDVFDGIQVVEIQERSVKLSWQGQDIDLSMKKIQPLEKQK